MYSVISDLEKLKDKLKDINLDGTFSTRSCDGTFHNKGGLSIFINRYIPITLFHTDR